MAALGTLTIDVHVDERDVRAALERDVRTGLAARPKSIPPTWFYDEEGSRLFEEITRLPEYYPTRAERALLVRHGPDIAALSGADTLTELGAGSCDKTRILLDALRDAGTLDRYVPFDVSADFLMSSATTLADAYEDLRVHAVAGDFLRHLDKLPGGGRRLVAFLGSTVGNLVPEQRDRFFCALHSTMTPSDSLLIGTDLVKDTARIVAAYDDAAGVTASFNRNVLSVLNRELDADFDPGSFDHVVRWDAHEEWIEMRLRASCAQHVELRTLGMSVDFEDKEELRTEISAKFTPQGVRSELERAGFVVDRQWGAGEGDFLLTLTHPYR